VPAKVEGSMGLEIITGFGSLGDLNGNNVFLTAILNFVAAMTGAPISLVEVFFVAVPILAGRRLQDYGDHQDKWNDTTIDSNGTADSDQIITG
jgi:hypothetical protein